MKKKLFTSIISFWIILQVSTAQIDTLFNHLHLTFKEYLNLVSEGNLEYAAGKFNVNISEAQIEAARIIPDPYVSFEWVENRENRMRFGHDYSSEIGTTIELGGKRRARTDVAKKQNEISNLLLEDFFRNLRAESALAYLNCLKQRQLYEVIFDSYQTMKRLSEADSMRFKLGSIMSIDAIQSKVEAGVLYNELIVSATEWKNSLVLLTFMTGQLNQDTLMIPIGRLKDTCRIFSKVNLLENAISNRSDLLASLKKTELSEKALDLVMRERVVDIDIKMGVSNSILSDEISPAVRGISGGISIPLKFSNINKGEIKISQALISQNDMISQQVHLQIETEITQSWNLYYVYCRQVENFEMGLLRNASDVLRGKIYSYRRGENSLLEVLNAQRTYNEVQTAYYEAIYNRAAALVNLEKAAGIWDIEF
jgi:outer membrane protein, heavy metal efflux system